MTTTNLPEAFQKLLLEHLPYADGGTLTADKELSALGLDSMGVVQLLAALEDHYDIDFPDELLNEETFATVGSLWLAVSRLAESVPADGA